MIRHFTQAKTDLSESHFIILKILSLGISLTFPALGIVLSVSEPGMIRQTLFRNFLLYDGIDFPHPAFFPI